jgi:hypothetical protein
VGALGGFLAGGNFTFVDIPQITPVKNKKDNFDETAKMF